MFPCHDLFSQYNIKSWCFCHRFYLSVLLSWCFSVLVWVIFAVFVCLCVFVFCLNWVCRMFVALGWRQCGRRPQSTPVSAARCRVRSCWRRWGGAGGCWPAWPTRRWPPRRAGCSWPNRRLTWCCSLPSTWRGRRRGRERTRSSWRGWRCAIVAREVVTHRKMGPFPPWSSLLVCTAAPLTTAHDMRRWKI